MSGTTSKVHQESFCQRSYSFSFPFYHSLEYFTTHCHLLLQRPSIHPLRPPLHMGDKIIHCHRHNSLPFLLDFLVENDIHQSWNIQFMHNCIAIQPCTHFSFQTSPKDKYNAMKNNTYCRYISSQQLYQTRECRNVCPDGAYHCSICKGCILQHNQHSQYLLSSSIMSSMVNNCIGLRNQKSYISYLLFTSLFDIVNVVYSTFMIWKINQLSDVFFTCSP